MTLCHKTSEVDQGQTLTLPMQEALDHLQSHPFDHPGPCNGPGPTTMVICHRTPSGEEQTLDLPIQAALTHLQEHPLDTPGPCNVVTASSSEPVPGVRADKTEKKTPTKKKIK